MKFLITKITTKHLKSQILIFHIFEKNKINEFKNELKIAKNNLKQDKIDKEEIKFLKMNSLYGKKCRKNFFNNLYKEGTQDYKNCILNKGPDKKNE
jgi:hypothetical protein